MSGGAGYAVSRAAVEKLRTVSDWCLHHFGAFSEGDVAFGACCEEVQETVSKICKTCKLLATFC